jgi:hypothetical protein
MTFRETLDKHLRALQQHDLQALRETLPAEELVLIAGVNLPRYNGGGCFRNRSLPCARSSLPPS